MAQHVENARVYDGGIDRLRSPERTERLEVGRVTQLCLKEKNVSTLLDIGTGSGLFAESFWKAGVDVTGVDLKPDMIEAARRHLPQGKFHVAQAEALPFPDESFDAAFFGVVFHEVADYAKALREAYRVTRHAAFILEWQHRQEEFGPPLEHRLSEDFLRDLAIATGYRDISVTPLNTLVLFHLRK